MTHPLQKLVLTMYLTQMAGSLFAAETNLPIPRHGTLSIELPTGWDEERRATTDNLPPTLEFKCLPPLRGSLQLTVMWSPKDDPSFGDEQSAKNMTLLAQKQIQPLAVETDLSLIRMKGAQGSGFYFSATDREFKPGPGQYPVVTSGVLGSGKILLIFTILSNAKDDQVVQMALSSISKASIASSQQVSLPKTGTSRIEVPGEGWALVFDTPTLMNKREGGQGGAYQFTATSGRFNISAFVEPPSSSGSKNQDCFNYYWPLASRNPQIQKSTIQISETPRFHRVQYDVVGTFKGEPFTQRNVNYFFAFRGKWIDVHISVINPRPEDEPIIPIFDRTLAYEGITVDSGKH
jgi:hypothetical protein